MSYVNYEITEKLEQAVLDLIQELVKSTEDEKSHTKIRKGINEATKAVERKPKPDLVVIAGDIDPPEIAMHMPIICQEQNVDYAFVKEKETLGKAVGIHVSSAAVAFVGVPKTLKTQIGKVVKQIKELQA